MRDLVAGNLGLLVAFGAGIVAFVSPCILPILPSFLSFLGGVGGVAGVQATADQGGRVPPLVKVLFFVLGFSLVFVALGILFSGFGVLALGGLRTVIYRVAGAVIVFFGINLVFDFWRALNVERRFHVHRRPLGVVGSLAVGVAFGAGWTPCVGPVLASILFLAGTTGSVGHGALLLVAFSLGLGLPFILAGAFLGRFMAGAHWLRRHARVIRITSGVVLTAIGGMVFAGSLVRLNVWFSGLASGLQGWRLSQPLSPRLVFGSGFLVLAAGVFWLFARRRAGAAPLPAVRSLLPLGAAIVLLSVSALIFADILRPDTWIGSWLRFQGV